MWEQATKLQLDKDNKGAEAIWRQVIALDSQNSVAYYNLGLSLFNQDNYDEAETAFRKVIELDPNYSNIYYWLGSVLKRQNREVEAEAALRQAVQLNPKDSKSQNLLGSLLYDLNRFAEAEVALRLAIQLDPQNVGAEYYLGKTLMAQKRYAEAEIACRKALELLPDNTELQQALQSVIDMEKKDREQASQQANSAFADVNARGQFSFIARDGRTLTGQEADKVPLEEGGRLITGSDGHVQLVLPDETVFTVGPNSDVVIDQFVYDTATDAHTIMAKLSKGVFRWVTGKTAHKDPASMKVTLPVGTLGIRGTDFEATVLEDGSGVVKLYSGQLEITETKTGRIFLLSAGETVSFGSNGIFSLPK